MLEVFSLDDKSDEDLEKLESALYQRLRDVITTRELRKTQHISVKAKK